MQEKYINVNNLKISKKLHNFVNDELLKDTEISPDSFWDGFDKVVHELAPKNKELLNINKRLFNIIFNNLFIVKSRTSVSVIFSRSILILIILLCIMDTKLK